MRGKQFLCWEEGQCSDRKQKEELMPAKRGYRLSNDASRRQTMEAKCRTLTSEDKGEAKEEMMQKESDNLNNQQKISSVWPHLKQRLNTAEAGRPKKTTARMGNNKWTNLHFGGVCRKMRGV